MRSPGRSPLVLSLVLVASASFAADDVKISAGAVEDQRFSDARMGGLTVELKLSGSSIGEVKALRARVKSAKDNVGTDLAKAARDEKNAEFEEFAADRRPGPRLTLGNPSRDASTIDVTADVELFIPSRDPNTKQRFENFLARADKPLSSSVLKAAKIEITPLSPNAYKNREQQSRPTKEQIMEEGKKHGASEEEIKQAIEMMDALASLGGGEASETSVMLETKDPDGKIISIDVVKADGSELHSGSRSSNGQKESKLVKIDLSEKPPPDAALVVTLRTSKSLVTVPVKWKEVALP